MPSDPTAVPIDDPVAALAVASMEHFRSSLATTITQLHSMLAAVSGDEKTRTNRMATSLGSFAGGRVDAHRFASFAQDDQNFDASAGPILERSIAVLKELHDAGNTLNQLHLKPGQNLRCLMSRSLRNIGRAFGAARVAQLAKSGCFDEKEHGPLLDNYLYRHWGPEQRALAPLMVIRVENGDAQTTNLGEFLDGTLKVVLDFGDTSPVAPMARLISPNTFVVQTSDPTSLEDFAAWQGPGAAALVPATCAQFVHNPNAGKSIAERLSVSGLPDSALKHNFGGLSQSQQQDDLEHLRALSEVAAPAHSNAEEAPTARPVDKLAALLLNKAHLEEV